MPLREKVNQRCDNGSRSAKPGADGPRLRFGAGRLWTMKTPLQSRVREVDVRSLKSRLRGRAGSNSFLFEVGGMACGSCAARIEGILSAQPGVRSAAVDLAANRARVTLSSEASPDGVVTAVEEAGYTMVALPPVP